KDEHIDLCLHQPVESGHAAGLGAYSLEHDALPEVDLDAVDLSVEILGRRLEAPILIGAMTGGTPRAEILNHRLARVAARLGLGMALGSQRAMIEAPQHTRTFAVRDAAPNLPLLLGNLGAVQLNYGVTTAQINAALEAVGADALNLHLNPLQEAIQPQGDTRFKGLRAALVEALEGIARPTLIKEVGAGISRTTALKLAGLKIAGLEVAGVGGTSWAKVESLRGDAPIKAEVGRRLAGFGVDTATSIGHCRAALGPDRLVIASGGVRGGHDVAVALALGADAAALSAPLLRAAEAGEDALERALRVIIEELRVVCFCAGCPSIKALRAARLLRRAS
ncbi:type 2 isopentenyl-diphosphate Delta-isomerase, partial [Myxococcota bacterium]|nr:type 2 isopentenyl-diphosphate Delta-isomerase [Myxococcota bacterium]